MWITLLISLLCLPIQIDTCSTEMSQYYSQTVKETVIEYELTEQEFETICLVVAAESRGECLEGQMAVAEVIKNRSELWGMDILTILNSQHQFAKPYTEFNETTYKAVNNIFRYNMSVFDEPITFFHSVDVEPNWSLDKETVGQIGRHIFYK